jgi:hypothetical protein
MPPNPKKKGEKKKKKKVKSDPKPSAGTEKDLEVPVSDPPVENQPNTNVETPSTEGTILEKINPNLQDPGTQVKSLSFKLYFMHILYGFSTLIHFISNRVIMKNTPLHQLTMRKVRPKTLAPIASRSI